MGSPLGKICLGILIQCRRQLARTGNNEPNHHPSINASLVRFQFHLDMTLPGRRSCRRPRRRSNAAHLGVRVDSSRPPSLLLHRPDSR